MKTKALLLTATMCAALVPSAIAQVYSVNAVGYINVPETPLASGDFAIIANQLDDKAGNLVKNVIPTAPDYSVLYLWNEGAQTYTPLTYDPYGTGAPDYLPAWTPLGDADTAALPPGAGAFLLAGSGGDAQLTFVGDVPQGPLTVTWPKDGSKFALISSKVPQAGTPQQLGMVPGDYDVIYQFDIATQGYKVSTWDPYGTGAPDYQPAWTPYDVANPDRVQIKVGEGFWMLGANGSSGTWVRNFDINDPNS